MNADVQEDMHSDSDDCFEDVLGDDMFCDESVVISKPNMPLIAEGCCDQVQALSSFAIEFANRYGYTHPQFYLGSLQDALKDSLLVKPSEKKQLAVYVHNDASILSNVFCSQVLCAPSVIDYLTENFVTWAWDVTASSNAEKLAQLCTESFGTSTSNMLRAFKTDEYPLLLLVTRTQGAFEIPNVIQGNTTSDELLSQLIQSHDVFRQQIRPEVQEEQDRIARDLVKREQDEAYAASLAHDKEKMDSKRKQELEERTQKLRQEEEQAIERLRKEKLREDALARIPQEPSKDSDIPLTTIRIRLPAGGLLTRLFCRSDELNVLLDFVVSKGFYLEDYKLLQQYPRRDLTACERSSTLLSLKLYPQETLILEQREQ